LEESITLSPETEPKAMFALSPEGSQPSPAIELIEVAPDWYVRIVDREGRETVKIFPLESFAVAFAQEHCRLLGIVDFLRL
jgi:hypothetical protein